jgi:hypothetical protein
MISSYSDLSQLIQDATEDDGSEFTAHIPEFISFAEKRLSRDLDTFGYTRHAFALLSAGDPFMVKPSATLVVKSLMVSTSEGFKFLTKKTDEFIAVYWPVRTSTGVPRYYAEWDQEAFIMAPTPVSGYSVEMAYVVEPTALTSSHTTNWNIQYAPAALYYACMIEANKFIKNWGAAQTWEGRYQGEVSRLKNEARRTRRDDGQIAWNLGGENNIDPAGV